MLPLHLIRYSHNINTDNLLQYWSWTVTSFYQAPSNEIQFQGFLICGHRENQIQYFFKRVIIISYFLYTSFSSPSFSFPSLRYSPHCSPCALPQEGRLFFFSFNKRKATSPSLFQTCSLQYLHNGSFPLLPLQFSLLHAYLLSRANSQFITLGFKKNSSQFKKVCPGHLVEILRVDILFISFSCTGN